MGGSKGLPTPQAKDLEEPFRHEVFKMLKAEGKINDVVIENMMKWPPARRAYRAYASESTTVDLTFIVVKPFGRTMKRAWPPARRAYASERKPGALYYSSLLFPRAHDLYCSQLFI